MKTGIVAVEVGDLGFLDGGYHLLRDEFHVVGYAGKVLYGIKEKRAAGAQQGRGLTGEDCAVFKFYGCGCNTGFFKALVGRDGCFSIGRGLAFFITRLFLFTSASVAFPSAKLQRAV